MRADPDPLIRPEGTVLTGRPRTSREFPLAAIIIAGAVVLALLAASLFLTRSRGGAPAGAVLPLDPYAADLSLSALAMSESTSLSGGKSTFLDGHIRNTGQKIVLAATVQVFFRNDENLQPTVETLPVTLIRTREPYIDTEPISAEPLKPGDDREFRLIFETLPANWNTQLPEVHVVSVRLQ